MKKIFKCKNLFLVTFLAIAGFFSAAAGIISKQSEESSIVERADAAGDSADYRSADGTTNDDADNIIIRILTNVNSGYSINEPRTRMSFGGKEDTSSDSTYWSFSSTWFGSYAGTYHNYNEIYLNGLSSLHYWYAELRITGRRQWFNSPRNSFTICRLDQNGTQRWGCYKYGCTDSSIMRTWLGSSFTSNSIFLDNEGDDNEENKEFGAKHKGIIYKIQLQSTSSVNGSGNPTGYSTDQCLVYQTTYECVLPAPKKIPSGYRFTGWKDASGTEYSSFKVSKDTVLYAQYEKYDQASSYTIMGSGSFMQDDQSWKAEYGLRMFNYTDTSNYAKYEHLYLSAGDVLKIYDGQHYFGWNDINTDSTTLRDSNFYQGKHNYIEIGGGTDGWETWGYRLDDYPDANNGSGETNDVDGTWTIYWKIPSSGWTWLNGIHGVRVVYSTTGEYLTGHKSVAGKTNYYENFNTINDRSYLEGLSVYKSSTGDNNSKQSTGYIVKNKLYNGNIIVKTAGYYNIYIRKNGTISIFSTSTFNPGESIYMKIGSSGWDTEGATGAPMFAAHFFHNSNTNVTADVWGVLVQGDASNTDLYEFVVPSLPSGSNYPNRVIFCRCNPDTNSKDGRSDWIISGHRVWNATDGAGANQSVDISHNIYVLQSNWANNGDFSSNKTTLERANNFGTYFMTQTDTVCPGYNTNTASSYTTVWTNVKNQYDAMNDYSKSYFTNSVGNTSGSSDKKNQAAIRYDYIVHKYSTLSDFASRKDTDVDTFKGSSAINHFNPFILLNDDSEAGPTLIIIIASSISLLSITALSVLLVKKRKSKQQ